ncbi:MAG: SusD/RagB family nutrient-binding outer membrane lipoprotein [Mediterranea sp.]|jgi:hypothetical protein|nr:SusD/RagB family nutrient-binding outer membrane lipoprotein [Mediterranea sp.]
MNNNRSITARWLLASTAWLLSCTAPFKSYNTDNTGFPHTKQEYDLNRYGLNMLIIQKGIYFNYDWGGGVNWPFQVMQNLTADMFCGYFHDCTKELFAKNSVYNLDEGWTSSNWINTYGYIMPAIHKSEAINSQAGMTPFLGITKILKVAVMHRIADQYGPLVYSRFGTDTGSDPETLQEAYHQFFADLEEGIRLIQTFITTNPGTESFHKFDLLTRTKTYDEWLRFANSLRLRLAIRISNVDRVRAGSETRKCFQSGIGFLQAGTHLISVDAASGIYTNPLGEINKSWGEVFINANMQSFLTGYEDPRLPKYFETAEGNSKVINKEDRISYRFPIERTYAGIRQGINVKHGNYSRHAKSTVAKNTNAILMTPAEVWFLRAEAALRNYTTESPGSCYENGIRASLSQWGVGNSINSYLNSNKTPAGYKDAFESRFDISAATGITPKWNDDEPDQRKLERIITQKWIASYPEGVEAWSEQRRTGYPKLFPVKENNSNGTIDTGIMIRRIPFPATLRSSNPCQYDTLLKHLGGADNGGTRLWWDVGYNIL